MQQTSIRSHSTRKPPSLLVQFVDAFLIELTNWRWSWRALLVLGTITPLFGLVGLGVFARDSGREALAYVQAGNLVMGLMFSNMGNVQNHLMYMRFSGMLDYFAALPLRRTVLILAILSAFLLLSLPSLLANIVLGALILRVPLHVSPLLVLVVPLCALPLAGIGALIGTQMRTPQSGNTVHLLVTMALLCLGPVMIPPSHLPPFMTVLGYFSPATYAASAFRQTLLGPITGQLWVDLLVLLGLTVGIFWLVDRKLDWRQR